MSVTLTKLPKAYDFSGNMSEIEFQCTDYVSAMGLRSLNYIDVGGLPANTVLQITYGKVSFKMTAVPNPDDSGMQFPSAQPNSVVIDYFENNYHLTTDFEIVAHPDSTIISLRAKVASPEYDIANFTVTGGQRPIYKEGYGVLVSVFCENADNSDYERIYHQTLPLFDKVSGKIKFQLNDKLNDYISNDIRTLNPDIPSGTFVECTKSCRKYYLEYYEVVRNNPLVKHVTTDFTMMHGGLSFRAQLTSSLEAILQPTALRENDRFLKQGPRMVYTRENQPQYLYFFNSRSAALGAELQIKYFFDDGSTDVLVLKKFDLLVQRKYAFNVTFDSFYSPVAYPGKAVDRYEVCLKSSTQVRISELRSFSIDRSLKRQIRYFLSWGSFGSLDTRVCYGEGSTEFQVSQSLAEGIVRQNQDIKRGSAFVFNMRSQSRFAVSTGFVSKAELVLWRDFYLSALKYRQSNGILMPVLLLTETLKETDDGSELSAHSFEYRYLYDDHSFTEGDIEEAGKVYKDILFFNQTAPEGALATNEGNVILSENQCFIVN